MRTKRLGQLSSIAGLIWMVGLVGLSLLLGKSWIVYTFGVLGWLVSAGLCVAYIYRFAFVKDKEDD